MGGWRTHFVRSVARLEDACWFDIDICAVIWDEVAIEVIVKGILLMAWKDADPEATAL